MKKRTHLKYADEAACIQDIELLRRGYTRAGAWDLPQTCYHCWWPINEALNNAASDADAQQSADELIEFMNQFLRLAAGSLCIELPSPPRMQPASHTDPSAIDDLIRALGIMRNRPHDPTKKVLAGKLDYEEFRQFALIHNAHHFAFLVPIIARRVELKYQSEADIIADLRKLQKGHQAVGNWTLEQTAWHLEATTSARMQPSILVPNTPEQNAKRKMFEKVLVSGRLPDGLETASHFVPPETVEGDPVEKLIHTLQKFSNHQGRLGAHRIFGTLSLEEGRRLNRIHCAHHLSYFVPTESK